MKTKSVYCLARKGSRNLAIALATLLAAHAAPAATLYWDGSESGGPNGGSGTWDMNSTANWWNGSADVVWPASGTDNAIFGGSGGTVTIDVAGVTSNSLSFTTDYTLSGGPLTLGGGGITDNSGGYPTITIGSNLVLSADQTWAGGTDWTTFTVNGNVDNDGHLLIVNAIGGNDNGVNISGVISGVGGLTKNGISALHLNGVNTYTGVTTLNGGTLELSGASGSILPTTTSSGIVLNGGSLKLTNNSAGIDRVGDDIPITSHGGRIEFNNNPGAVYAEILGAVTLSGGQTAVYLNRNQTGSGSQTLTLSGLTHNGTSVVTFWGPGVMPDATTNVIRNSAVSVATPANQIIGPWATTEDIESLSYHYRADYAVYDGSGRILPANIPASAETAWTTPALAYTMSSDQSLTATRTITALRNTAGGATLNLNGFNLETTGILNGAFREDLAINGPGSVMQNGTAAANLYVTAGSGNIFISAPIIDNDGAVTLVKSGTGYLFLSGNNTYSGGLVLNSTFTILNSSTATGTGTLTFAGGSFYSWNKSERLANNNPVVINADFSWDFSNMDMGTGAVTLGTTPGTTRTIGVYNNTDTLTIGGVIANGDFANSITKAGQGTLVLSGTNTYTGATTVTTGTLIAKNASALGSGPGNNVSVAASTALNYAASTDAPLVIGGTLGLSDGSTIGGAIGATATSAAINVTGAASATGTVTVNVYGISGVDGPTVPTDYTLVQGGNGSTLNAASYALGKVYNNTHFTVGSLTKSGTDLKVGITSAPALATAYWKGGLSGATGVWAASNGSTLSNWAVTSEDEVQGLVPGPGTDVTISADNTTLGADMSIQSLTMPGSLTLNSDGFKLTIGSGGVTGGTNYPDIKIYPNLVMSAAQTWAGGTDWSAFEVHGNVNNAGHLLTVNASGGNGVSIYGAISGAGGLTKADGGTLYLYGNNTYSGGTVVNAGTLKLVAANTNNIASSSSLNIASGAYLNVAGLSNSTLALASGQTLMGNGNVSGGLVTLAGASIAPGDRTLSTPAKGTLTIDNALDLTGGTTNIRLFSDTADDSDKLMTGTITFGGALNVSKSSNFSGTFAIGNSWDLFDWSGDPTGTFSSFALPSLSGMSWDKTSLYTTGVISIIEGGSTDSPTPAISIVSSKARFLSGVITTGVISGNVTNTGTLDYSYTSIANKSSATGTLSSIAPLSATVAATSGSQAYTASINGADAAAGTSYTFGTTVTDGTTPADSSTVSLTAVNQRSFSVGTTTIALGTIHAGAVTTGNTTAISSDGLHTVTADASLGDFVGANTGSLTLITGDPTAFNGATTQTATYSLGGSIAAGALSGANFSSTVTAELGSISDVVVSVTGSATNGLATWTASGNGNWSDHSKWTDSNGINAAPGTFGASFAGIDAATFDTGSHTVTVDTAVNLNALTFTGTGSYTLASGAGSLTLAGAGAKITSAGTQAISEPVILANPVEVAVSSGALTVSGGINGAGMTLLKSGGGILALSGSSNYSGLTTVDNGTLLVNSSIPGAVTVTSSGGTATLGGSGSIAGAVNVTGILSPGGSSLESLASGNLSLLSGSQFNYQASNNTNTGADLMVVGGTLSLTHVTLSLDATTLAYLAAATAGDKLTLLSYTTGITTGGFVNPSAVAYADNNSYLFGANRWKFDYNATTKGGNFASEATGTRFVTATLLDTYGIWADSKGLTGDPGTATDSAFTADPNKDGVSNGLVWILGGTDPLANNNSLLPHASGSASTGLTLTFNRLEASIGQAHLFLDYTSTLDGTWASVEITEATTGNYDHGGVTVTVNATPTPDAITVSIPTSKTLTGKLFARLRAVHP